MDPNAPPLLTNNEANFTVVIVIATGHHGPHSVIHHGHDVNVKVLREEIVSPQHLCCRMEPSCRASIPIPPPRSSWSCPASHPSLLDGLAQHRHHVLALHAAAFEPLCPRNEDALRRNSKEEGSEERPTESCVLRAWMDGDKAPGGESLPVPSCAISSDFRLSVQITFMAVKQPGSSSLLLPAGWSLIPVTGFYGALEQNLFPRLQNAP